MSVSAEFIAWLKSQVSDVRAAYAYANDGHAFACWALSYVYEISLDDAYVQSDTLGIGDGGIDGWHEGSADETFILTQAKWSNDPSTLSVGRASLDSLLTAYARLNDPTALPELAEKQKEIAHSLQDATKSGSSTAVLAYFIAGAITSQARRELLGAAGAFTPTPEVEFWDLNRIFELYASREGEQDLAGLTLTFRLAEPDVISVESDGASTLGDTVTAIVDGASLANVAAGHRPRIFAANVRHHLGGANRVNKSIRKTLESAEGRREFYYFNNGLTIVCESFTVFENEDNSAHIAINNPQIVNGGQTTNALIDRREHFTTDSPKVAVKVISLTGTFAERDAMSVRISERTNSQSPVRPEDLKANDPAQRALQTQFRLIGWFYERKRREWSVLSPAQRLSFPHQVRKEEVGQRWRAWSGHPNLIVEKEDLFTVGSVYGEVYDPSRSPWTFLLPYVIFDAFEAVLGAQNAELRAKIAPALSDEPYRRALRGKKMFLGHCLLASNELLTQVYGDLTPGRSQQLVKKTIADPANVHQVCRVVLAGAASWIQQLGEGVDVRETLKRPETGAQWVAQMNSVLAISDPDLTNTRNALPTLDG